MIAWRIDKARRSQAEAFSGVGAELCGGRWNRKGIRAVYASESLALSALETFVHAQADGRHISFVSYQIEIPESVAVFRPEMSDLPRDWRDEPAPPSTMDFGSRWISGMTTAVLLIPSVVVPSERNIVLNLAHPDYSKIKVSRRQDFSFDPRLWKAP